MIERHLNSSISDRLFRGKVILLFGPRQSGKTTLMEALLAKRSEPVLALNGDEMDVRGLLSDVTSTSLRALFGKSRIVFIDEAQRIQDIGTTLKLCVDRYPDIQLIATGSSAFELADRTMEPLTGRKYQHTLLPVSFAELVDHHGLIEERRLLETRLLYGSYPEIVTHQGEEEELLRLLASSYLFKDIMALGGVKKPVVLEKLIRALALQVGSEVSYHELAGLLGVSSRTVETYIDLLEKTFVVFRLPALARNVRNEIKKGKKVYFYDNGIRNAVIGNFAGVRSRADLGALWENYLVSERTKLLNNLPGFPGMYFWRTAQQQEIDYLEERDGEFGVYEFKWNAKKRSRVPLTFSKGYRIGRQMLVTPDNYQDFLLDLE